jgi:hypothetical protein
MVALETLAGGRWRTLTILEQMGNIGSEVERAIRAHEAGKPRRREILRAREEFCRLFFDPHQPVGSADGLRRYFLAFAIAARR